MRAPVVFALALTVAVPVRGQTIAIVGGTVHPVSGPAIPDATVLLRDGLIVAVGANVAIPGDAQRIDATGKTVTPGLIDASSHLGLVDAYIDPSQRDYAARGHDNVAASFRVWDGLNGGSIAFASARHDGVTSAVVRPDGGLIAGQGALIDLVPGSASAMVRRAPVAVFAQLRDPNKGGTGARGELIGKLRALLDHTMSFDSHRSLFNQATSGVLDDRREDLEALVPVVRGQLPLAVLADRADDIAQAARLGRDYRIRVIIVGGAEAWLTADLLAAADIPVATGAMDNLPTTFGTLNQRQDAAALLRKAGVRVVVTGTGGSVEQPSTVRQVRYEAGNAVRFGMSHDDALRAVTLTPAEVFGLSDRIGSLKPGLEANLVVWSGDPFEFSTRVEHLFIRGRDVAGIKSRKDLLMERYRTPSEPYRESR